jgi:hypothetical protein
MLKTYKTIHLIQHKKIRTVRTQNKRRKKYIMKSTEKINLEFESEHTSQSNPFINFTQSIKQFSNQNFIVEWQIDEDEKKEVTKEQISYGMIF